MKQIRYFIIFSICVIMQINILSPIVYASSFTDVSEDLGTSYIDAINYVSDNGIMNGTSSSTFSPEGVMTRAMVVTLLFKMSGDTGTYTNPFTDVLPEKYYYNAVGWAYANGIVAGTSATTFSPNTSIKKQQTVVILYKYAVYLGLEIIIDEDINQASDYSNVLPYAVDGLRWAYSYSILSRVLETDAIHPNAITLRKDMALMISRFRTNAEGLNFERDTFSFSNSGSNFISKNSKFLMSADDWDYLMELGETYLLSDSPTNISGRDWSGSCYGMAVITALDYIGKIDFNGNFCNDVSNMNEIPSLTAITDNKHQLTHDFRNPNKTITIAESKINFYQFSWFIKPINEWAETIAVDSGLRDLVEGQRHGGIGVFSYSYSSSNAHTINVYGKPETVAEGYRIKAYDNRYPYAPLYVRINTTGTAWTGRLITNTGFGEQFLVCKYQNNFDEYDIMDVDGLYNTFPNDAVFEDYSLLRVCTNGFFTIQNAENESIIYSENGIEGDMEIYRVNFLPFGEDAPVEYCFVVPHSESFTCTATGEGTIEYFYVTTDIGSDGINTIEYPETTIRCIQVNCNHNMTTSIME